MELLASLEAVNELGQVFNLFDIAQRGISNLTNRRNELMTRLSGFEEIAKERKDVSIFITLTAPSKFHSMLSKPCIPNPKYQGASPRDTHEYLNDVWKLIRAKISNLKIKVYGFRVVEPHHDGTPHWHILLFLKSNEVKAVTDAIYKYALAEDGDEAGAKQNRVKVKYMDPKKGSAVGYIAKYISKNIDGAHVGADHYGLDAIVGATRIRAWASIWKIRQFQQIGGPSVTVWRQARLFSTSAIAEKILEKIGDDHLQDIFSAADEGDWKSYVQLSGGPTAARKDHPLRPYHIEKETPNKYGEVIKNLIGLAFQGLAHIRTKIHDWLVRPVSLDKRSNEFGMGFALGGANAPPWSSVNNCTQAAQKNLA